MKIQEVLNIVASMLNDEEKVSWTENMLLNYFNLALREMFNVRPDLFNHSIEYVCQEGYRQIAPSDNLHFFKVFSNVNGRICKYMPLATLNNINPKWTTNKPDEEVEIFTYDFDNPKFFYVYPPAVNGLKLNVEYSQVDKWYLDTEEDFPLPSNWVATVMDYMCYRAYQRDTEFAPNDTRIQSHLTAFQQSLQNKAQADITNIENRTATWLGDKGQ